MSMLNRLMDSFKMNDYDEDDYLDDEYDNWEEEGNLAQAEPSKKAVRSLLPLKVVSNKKPMVVTMIRPASMEDSKVIADLLLEGKTVIINIEGIDQRMAARITDFVSGAVYCIDGSIRMISGSILMVAPASVTLSGAFSE